MLGFRLDVWGYAPFAALCVLVGAFAIFVVAASAPTRPVHRRSLRFDATLRPLASAAVGSSAPTEDGRHATDTCVARGEER